MGATSYVPGSEPPSPHPPEPPPPPPAKLRRRRQPLVVEGDMGFYRDCCGTEILFDQGRTETIVLRDGSELEVDDYVHLHEAIREFFFTAGELKPGHTGYVPKLGRFRVTVEYLGPGADA